MKLSEHLRTLNNIAAWLNLRKELKKRGISQDRKNKRRARNYSQRSGCPILDGARLERVSEQCSPSHLTVQPFYRRQAV